MGQDDERRHWEQEHQPDDNKSATESYNGNRAPQINETVESRHSNVTHARRKTSVESLHADASSQNQHSEATNSGASNSEVPDSGASDSGVSDSEASKSSLGRSGGDGSAPTTPTEPNESAPIYTNGPANDFQLIRDPAVDHAGELEYEWRIEWRMDSQALHLLSPNISVENEDLHLTVNDTVDIAIVGAENELGFAGSWMDEDEG